MVRRVLLAVMMLASAASAALAEGPAARELAPGLELLRFDVDSRSPRADGELHVLRVDPARWDLGVLLAARHADGKRRTLATWGREFELEAAVNAGMYQGDGSSHVGFSQVDGRVFTASPNSYQSAFVCDPVDTVDAPFAVVDLDETPLDVLRLRYRTVVQNLRLIKHPGRNRWSPGKERWREAALAEDAQGRALLVFCTRPLAMYEFNAMLLALPLDVTAAQHLEGSAAAGLWVRALEGEPDRASTGGTAVPNVLAVRPRGERGRP